MKDEKPAAPLLVAFSLGIADEDEVDGKAHIRQGIRQTLHPDPQPSRTGVAVWPFMMILFRNYCLLATACRILLLAPMAGCLSVLGSV